MLQEEATEKQAVISADESTGAKAGSLKFYLHDNSDAFRFQLIGQFTASSVTELNGCWRTARPSVAGRKIRLDLRGLTDADEAARDWLRKLVLEDEAECLIAIGGFSEVLGRDLGVLLCRGNSSAAVKPLQRRVKNWLGASLFRRGTNLKADDSSLVMARCR